MLEAADRQIVGVQNAEDVADDDRDRLDPRHDVDVDEVQVDYAIGRAEQVGRRQVRIVKASEWVRQAEPEALALVDE